jgi:SAM-dependent methyltransferase
MLRSPSTHGSIARLALADALHSVKLEWLPRPPCVQQYGLASQDMDREAGVANLAERRRTHPRACRLIDFAIEGRLSTGGVGRAACQEQYGSAAVSYFDDVERELGVLCQVTGRSFETCLDDLTRFNEIGAVLDNDSWYAQDAAFSSMHLDFLLLGFGRRRVEATLRQQRDLLPERGLLCEVGGGCGYFAARFLAVQPQWHCCTIDRSRRGAAFAARYHETLGMDGRSEVLRGDLRQLPFATHAFDAVNASEVIEHVRETDVALAELSRVLRPGGVLFVSVPIDLDIPMHAVVFSSPEPVYALCAKYNLVMLQAEMIAPALTDDIAAALPTFPGCLQAAFKKG